MITIEQSLLSDIILKVRQPLESEVANFRKGTTLVSFIYPGQNKSLVDALAARNINVFGNFNIWYTIDSKNNLYKAV